MKIVDKDNSLSSSLTLGTVELNVKDLEDMMNFYHTVMGLEILKRDLDAIVLGLLSLVGLAPTILNLVAILAIGAASVFTGASSSGVVFSISREK